METAMSSYEWADRIFSDYYRDKDNWTFHSVCTALDAEYLQKKKTSTVKDLEYPNNDTTQSVLYQQKQKMYGNPKQRFNKNKFNNKYKHKRCYNCNEKGHIAIHCPKKERKMEINVTKKLKKYPTKQKRYFTKSAANLMKNSFPNPILQAPHHQTLTQKNPTKKNQLT